jgi:hypothetical protein
MRGGTLKPQNSSHFDVDPLSSVKLVAGVGLWSVRCRPQLILFSHPR